MLWGAPIVAPVVLREYSFEKNPEYHEDGKSRERGLAFMKRFVGCFQGNAYLLATDCKAYLSRFSQPVNRIFIHSPALEKLDRYETQVDVGAEWPLSVAVIDLAQCDVDYSELLLFGSPQSIIVFTDSCKESIGERARDWIHDIEYSKLSSFNHKAMVEGFHGLTR